MFLSFKKTPTGFKSHRRQFFHELILIDSVMILLSDFRNRIFGKLPPGWCVKIPRLEARIRVGPWKLARRLKSCRKIVTLLNQKHPHGHFVEVLCWSSLKFSFSCRIQSEKITDWTVLEERKGKLRWGGVCVSLVKSEIGTVLVRWSDGVFLSVYRRMGSTSGHDVGWS